MEQVAGRMLERFAANVKEAIASGVAPAEDAPPKAPDEIALPLPRVPSGVWWALAGGAVGFDAGWLIGRSP